MWVAALKASEPGHLESRDYLERAIDQGDLPAAPTLVLPEVAAALARGLADPAAALAATDFLIEGGLVRLHAVSAALAALAADLTRDARVRGADAVYLALAKTLGVPLVTLDQQQLARGRDVARTFTPATAP